MSEGKEVSALGEELISRTALLLMATSLRLGATNALS
jgi:hypothetical protein